MTVHVRRATMALASLGLALAALSPAAALAQAPAAPAAPAAPSGPQPKAVADDLTFNAGDVPKGDVITHDFVVKNTGKADLMILSVQPACGCTAPDWTKIVPPGGTGKITLKVDTARFKGPISKTATVQTNDPELSSFRLTVNATVTTYIDVTPSETVMFRHYRGEEKREEITLHSNEKGEFKITEVKVTGDGIKHALARSADAPSDYKLTVWLDPSVPVGPVTGGLTLLTNSTKEPEVAIRVSGTVMGQVTASPSTLYFRVDATAAGSSWTPTTDNLNIRERGEIGSPVVARLARESQLTLLEEAGEWAKVKTESGQAGWVAKKFIQKAAAASEPADQSKILNLSYRQETGFSIMGTAVEGSKLDTGAVKVAVEPVKAGQSYRLTVTYAGDLDKGNYNGTLVIKTNDKAEPEVKIPIYVVVI